MLIAQHALRGRQVGNVVRDHLTLRENLLERGAARPERGKLLLAGEGIVHKRFHIIAAEHLQHERADHAGPQDADPHAVIAWEGVAERAEVLHAARLEAAHALEKAFPGQHDLRHGKLRHRHGVGRPGAEHPHPAAQEGTRKALHRTGRVEHGLEVRQIIRDLLLREGRHAPCGKHIGCAGQQIPVFVHRFGQDHLLRQVQRTAQRFARFAAVSAGQLVLLPLIQKDGRLFHGLLSPF